MIKLIKRISSAITASVLALSIAGSLPLVNVTAEESNVVFHAECENLTLTDGATVWTSIYNTQVPGYSGDGFIYLTNGKIKFEVDVPEEGMYEFKTRFVQILSQDGREQTISVNGSEYMVKFPYAETWQDISFGMFRLKKGVNEIELLPKYGYACFDTITVEKAVFPDLTIDPVLADKNATKETQGLMKYLCEIYGKNTISGQQEIYGGGHTADSPNGYSGADLLGYESEFEWIKKNFGDYPAIRGFDLMNTNPLYGWDDGTTERMIEWGEKNGIPTVCWHINLPTDFTNYEIGDALDWKQCSYGKNKTFDVNKATVEGTKEHEYVMLTIDLIAQELLKVQDAGVPVIFRPYHEAEGNGGDGEGAWFWWAQDGAEAFKKLWKQLYTTLTEDYGIHNLIWEYNSYTLTTSPQWYPGDDYVDIVGFDKYNTQYNRHDGKTSGPNEDAISGTFYNLVNLTDNHKLVSMPENDTVPSLENIMVEEAFWLYFCIWYDNGQENFLSDSDRYNNFDTLKKMYQSDFCITLSELPDWKNYADGDVKPTQATTEKPTEVPNPAFIPGDVTKDKTVNVFDAVALRELINHPKPSPAILSPSAADTNGNGTIEVADLVLLHEYLVGLDVELHFYNG